jgi:hypothetical protein
MPPIVLPKEHCLLDRYSAEIKSEHSKHPKMADGQQNPKKTLQGDRQSEEMTPQDYLRQIKANYPDLKQNMEMKVWVLPRRLLILKINYSGRSLPFPFLVFLLFYVLICVFICPLASLHPALLVYLRCLHPPFVFDLLIYGLVRNFFLSYFRIPLHRRDSFHLTSSIAKSRWSHSNDYCGRPY